MNHLALEWMTTRVTLHGAADVQSLGFVVDEQPLVDWVKWTAGEEFVGYCEDRVAPFAQCFTRQFKRDMYRLFLGKQTSTLPHERVPLYLCPCGDAYCGGLMAQVSRAGDRFIWSNWGSVDVDIPGLPNLEFDAQQYTLVLGEVRGLFSP